MSSTRSYHSSSTSGPLELKPCCFKASRNWSDTFKMVWSISSLIEYALDHTSQLKTLAIAIMSLVPSHRSSIASVIKSTNVPPCSLSWSTAPLNLAIAPPENSHRWPWPNTTWQFLASQLLSPSVRVDVSWLLQWQGKQSQHQLLFPGMQLKDMLLSLRDKRRTKRR